MAEEIAEGQKQNDRLPMFKIFAILLISIALLGIILVIMASQSKSSSAVLAPNPNSGTNANFTAKDCVKAHGFDETSALFYYSGACPICQSLTPEINSLQASGRKIILIHPDNPKEMSVLSDCFAGKMDLTTHFHQMACPSIGKVFPDIETNADLVSALDECGA